MSGVVVRSDRCGLDELFLAWVPGEAGRGRLGLGREWSRRWTGTWRTSDGAVACAVRDLGSVAVAGCRPMRRFSWGRRQRHRPGLQFMVLPQPFRLRFETAAGEFREHVPDFLAVFDDGSRWLFDVRPAELVEERDAACFAAAAEAALEAGWRDPTWRDLRHASDPRASYTHLRAELDSLAAALATAIDTAGHTHLKIASVKPRAVNRGGTIYDWEPDIRHPQAIAASEEITVSGAVSGRTAHGNPVAGPRPCRLTARVSFDFQAAYDELNPADDDYRFYAALAASAGVSRAVDLGCGTGTLARMLASAGAAVTGVDPDPDMLRVARAKDPASRVDWRLGYSDAIEPASTELAVMSGHVAQVFTEDGAWLAVLRDLHRALVPGGLLAFESRNPSARKWEDWTRELALRTVETPEGPVEFWHETADVSLPLVSYDTLTRNLSTGHATVARDVLAFRDERALRATLEHAGFNVQHVYGDWDQTAPAAGSPELIVIARRP